MELIICKICGGEYQLLNSHLRSHGLTPTEYRIKFPGASTCTEEVRKQISETTTKSMGLISEQLSKSQNERYARPGEREHLSEVSSAWWAEKEASGEKLKYLENSFHSEAAREKFRQMHKDMTPEEREEWVNRSFCKKWTKEGFTEDEKKAYLKSCVHSDASLLASRKSGAKRPTEPEYFLGLYLEDRFPGKWEYNGDGSKNIIVGGRTPDYIRVDGAKEAVSEMGGLGRYHFLEDEPLEVEHYAKYGYKCTVVWEWDCYLVGELDKLFGVTSDAAANP